MTPLAADVAAIAAHFLDAHAADAPYRRGPRSVTGCVTVAGQRFFCKTSDEGLANEAEALEACRALPGGGAYAVPFVGYDADRNVLVTEPVEGGNLFNRLWNATDPWRIWEAPHRRFDWLFLQLARWLRAFHSLPTGPTTPRKTPRTAIDHLLTMIDARLHTVRAVGDAGLSEAQLDAVARIAQRLARSEAWATQPMAMIHGDLTPVNILAESDRSLVVIDFGNVRHGYALEDLARLWTSLWEIAQTTAWRRHWLGSAMDVLIAGFGQAHGVIDSEPFTFLRVWNGVTRLHEAATTARRYRPPAAKLHRALLIHHIRYLRALAAEGDAQRRAA